MHLSTVIKLIESNEAINITHVIAHVCIVWTVSRAFIEILQNMCYVCSDTCMHMSSMNSYARVIYW